MKLLFSLFLFFFINTCFANNIETLLKRIRGNYENIESFQQYIHYTLYKGHSSETIFTEYNSLFNEIGKDSYRKLQDVEIINSNSVGINLTINHSQKSILVSKAIDYSIFDFDI